jgi:hypothetical protein
MAAPDYEGETLVIAFLCGASRRRMQRGGIIIPHAKKAPTRK